MSNQFSVFTLVEEKAGFLAFFPVGKKTAVVFQNHFIQSIAKEVTVLDYSIFLAHALHGFGTFVVDGLQAKVGHQLEGADNLLQVECHAFRLGLHHGGVAINVNDKPCQAVAFGVDEAEAVGVGIVGESHSLAHFVGLVKAFEEKPFVDSAVLEAEDLHGNAIRFAEACAEDVAIIVGDGDGIASLQAFGCIVDGT